MSFEQKIGFGALFKNNRKEKENHPDYTGSLRLLNGETINLAGWKKKDKNGETYLSICQSKPKPVNENEPPF